ncbi:Na(+)-translocating NADH-quinone reductase subunit A [Bacteroidia bacterium]|nr:Na(+)-translocating NADH-quinone reductase subunit A [Bacteroidia bacterium]
MSRTIHLKCGFDIRINGDADKSLMASIEKSRTYAVKPMDFYGVQPKLQVAQGDYVKAGAPLFYSKQDSRIVFTSPVSGTILDICRGENRVIEEIRITPTETIDYEQFSVSPIQGMTMQQVKTLLLQSGLWACIRQRPYHTIANPDDMPKMIVISAFDTAPLAADYDFIAHRQGKYFQAGLDAVNKLTTGKIHLNVHTTRTFSDIFLYAKGVDINTFSGPHPSGNVGVQIHHINPINKGEVVWFINPQDVITMGKLFLEGIMDATKIVALAGSEVKRTGYHKILSGACIGPLIHNNLKDDSNPRFISGNVLTGTRISEEGYLGFYDHLVSVIPEGNKPEFMGWVAPGFDKFSFWRTFFSWITGDKQYVLDTNYHGENRALIFTEQYERVLPMDILPGHLIKACIAGDVEAMEALGIYEVAAEDFALCEYIDPSKTEIQSIIQQGMDLIKQEML